MKLTVEERAELAALEAASGSSNEQPTLTDESFAPGFDDSAATRLAVLRARAAGQTPTGLAATDVLSDVNRALGLLDDNADFDDLRSYELIDAGLYGACTLALKALRDSILADIDERDALS